MILNVLDAYKKQVQEQKLFNKITEYIESGKDFRYFKCEYYKEKFNSIRYKEPEYYNVKHIEYLNSEQYIFYAFPVKTNFGTFTTKTRYIEEDGIQYNKETREQRTEESIKHSMYSSLNRTKQKIYDYALANDWGSGYFFTITLNPEFVDSFNYDECYKRIYQFLKNVKSKNPNFKYIFVPEFHKSGRIHWHGLGVNCENLKLVDSGKVVNGKKIYNINSRSFKYGFTTVSKVEDTTKVSAYITKYITKELISNTKGKHRYLFSKNLDVPTVSTELIEIDEMELNKMLLERNKNFKYKKVFTGHSDSANTIEYIHLNK